MEKAFGAIGVAGRLLFVLLLSVLKMDSGEYAYVESVQIYDNVWPARNSPEWIVCFYRIEIPLINRFCSLLFASGTLCEIEIGKRTWCALGKIKKGIVKELKIHVKEQDRR